jgi:DNA-binding NarL/FixJ family response regulator
MSGARGNVLVADDEHGSRDILGRSLRKEGFLVEAVCNGKEALQALRNGVFDVLLADLNMPGNARLELLTLMRDEQVLLPVVLMTGAPTIDSAIGALRLGVLDYITKPFELDELVTRLDVAIEKGRALHALADAKQRAQFFAESVAVLELAINAFTGPAPARASSASPDKRLDPLANLSPDELSRLSPREREITRLLALGNGVGSVATTLNLSPNTVRNHIKSIFVKLQVHSQLALLSKLAGHPLARP